MRTRLLLASALVVLGCLAGGCEKRKGLVPVTKENMVAAEVSDPAFEHPNYRFKIDGLDNRWKILPTDEAAQMVPDAAGGAVRVGGLAGVVIVEPLGEVAPDSHLDLIVENMCTAVPGMVVRETKEVEFHGRSARRASMDGNVSGIAFHYELITFVHQGHGYQLLCWHHKLSGADHPVQEFFDAIDLVEGDVTLPPVEPPSDFVGAGRRIEAGRFESPVFRLAAVGRNNWELMDATSLQQISPDAELGLQHRGTGTYLMVITERTSGLSLGDYLDYATEQLELAYLEMGAVKKLEPTTIPVGATATEFRQMQVEASLPLRVYLGCRVADGIAYQFQAWHFEQKQGNMKQLIAEGLECIEFMDKSTAEAKQAELIALPDMQAAVGPGFSLRNKIFRDYEYGVAWAAPPGIWRFTTGHLLMQENPDARFEAANISEGLYLQLISEPADDWSSEDFHAAVMSNHAAPAAPDRTTTIDGRTVRISEVIQHVGQEKLIMRIGTTLHDGSAHLIAVWGYEQMMKERNAEVDAIMQGFRFPGNSLVAKERSPTTYTDYRMGFELRLPKGRWTVQESVQPAMDPIGSTIQWSTSDGYILLLSFHVADNRQADAIVQRMISESLKVNFDRSSRSGAGDDKVMLAGCAARQLKVDNPQSSMRALTFSDRGTMFLIMIGAEKRSRADELLTDVKRKFRLLE